MAKQGITPTQAQKIRAKKGLPETKLQKLRVKKNLTQQELSAITGISVRTLQQYEQYNSDRSVNTARLESICELCLALGCKIEDILEDKNLIVKYKAVK